MDVSAVLEAGKKYHIFLVGDWLNPENPQTDYDVIAQSSYDSLTFTEATGLPEQVSNDPLGQFYIPQQSGIYHFLIHNDPEDSHDAQPAIFMIIEHVDTDKRYSAELQGRLAPGDSPKPLFAAGYEFTTSVSNFTVFVDTPDEIDMFEARVYPMANMEGDSYDLNGQLTPQGTYLNNTYVGDYGGYNTTFQGYRNSRFFTSCNSMGDKMEIKMSMASGSTNSTSPSNSTSAGSPVTYFLVLIAEYSKFDHTTQVPFYIKTSTVEPTLSLNGTMGDVFAGEPKKVSAIVSSPYVLKSVWMNFTVNGDPGELVTYFSKIGQLYEGEMPAFASKDVVDWSIFAVDEMGNVGRIDSSFNVRARTETSCLPSPGSVQAGETVEVFGHTSVPSANITLDFTAGSFKDSIKVKANATGNYRYSYLSKQPGVWSVQAAYLGNDVNYPSKSPPVSFTMTPLPTTISVALDPQVIKVNQELRLSGTTSPAMAGLMVDVTLASGGNVTTETLTTKADGSFSLVTPLVEGEWDVVAQVRGNWKFSPSSSGIVKATVLPLTIVDQAMIVAAMAASPPYIYVVLLASAIVIALVVRWRVPDIASKLPKPVQALLARLPARGGGRAKKADNGGKGRYRRQGEEE